MSPSKKSSLPRAGSRLKFGKCREGTYFSWKNNGCAPSPQRYTDFLGRKLFLFLLTAEGIGAFALITLGVIVSKKNVASKLIHPMIRHEIYRAGVRLLPMYLFVAFVLGFLVIGQTVSVAAQFGAVDYTGTIMVTVIIRELGPLLAAILALARVGAAYVIELGTARALGEVEALEEAGIDPIHYLVAPRVIGITLGVFSLTVYLILASVFSGYLFVFLQNVPLTPGHYFFELVGSLSWLDFVLLALKSLLFGFFIGIVSCYHGLAQPLRVNEVSRRAIYATTQCIIVCVIIDAVFFLLYLGA
jgi:phospholipid/cholesterol/gamma-HCH transport system permease protein